MINSGSASTPDCAELLRRIADLEHKYAFTLVASWVPREFNEAADQTSRNNIALVQEAMEAELQTSLLNVGIPFSLKAGRRNHPERGG